MNMEKGYKDKLVTADEAVKHIKSGDRVVFQHAAGEPIALVDALVKNKGNYKNVEIVHLVALGKGEYTSPEMEGHFIHNSIFVGGCTRKAVLEGRADFTPCYFTEVPRLFQKGYLPVDVTLISVTPPDNHGFCSLGVSVDYTKPALESSKMVIAQVNKNMPRTYGDSLVHISQIDYFVEADTDILGITPPVIGEVEKAIGENVATLVEDGATLQLGIGAIPDAALLFLKDKKDLGIHSEMISDGVLELINSGVITNKKKTLHKDKNIVTFLMGTRNLYDFIDNNPSVEVHSVDYVNNPTVIMKNYKMTCINSCIQLDLTGQICSESIGIKQFSGVGGQVDFMRGASMADDGKSIIAIPSTASKGKVSRIVPILDEGAIVTTTRNDVHYVVTEYGIADLRGKSVKERGRALISIAHPDFREELIRYWKEKFNCLTF
ncbi:acetyl-CoA hydrolase/transferase C-terminal domain-containing protein [Clostridium sp.]